MSRIKLNTALRKTMQALNAPNLFHGAIESSEHNGRTRKLWRIDSLNGEKYLLILSNEKPDFSQVAMQFGGTMEYESKSYDKFLDRITTGSIWHFRLKANPVIQKKIKDPKSKGERSRGKAVACKNIYTQGDWLVRQAEKNGFSLIEDNWLITESKWQIFKKNKYEKTKVKMLTVTYEGLLTVTDEKMFKNALINGIGREKAFGLGLLTVARVAK